MGIVVESRSSELFRLRSDPRTGLVKVDTNSGSYQFPSWRVSYARLPGERQAGVEQLLVGERYVARWSQAILAGRLLGIGVVQPHLASLGDLESSGPETPESARPPEGEFTFGGSVPGLEAGSPQIKPHPSLDTNTTSTELPFDSAPLEPKASTQIGQTTEPSVSDPIDRIGQLQERSWASRPGKARRHARVAFFQWELDQTYRHPIFDACMCDFSRAACLDAQGSGIKHPEKWNEPGETPSCIEHRRRALLRAVLRACHAFKVDILLLPEYSIRPDTAIWLTENLPDSAPSTSVWAGTYRQPPGMHLKVMPDGEQPSAWSAVMPIIVAPGPGEPNWKVSLRKKKYPAVAANEAFCPGDAALEPQFKARSVQFDPRSYCSELICSEAFLVTSPANILGMVHAVRRLRANFGESRQPTESELEDQIIQDVKSFAYYTSLSHALDQPRLLLLVPAMTTRSRDYSILGQASFLASAVTTVFCNAVAGRFGCGESCIIGHDSWGKEGGKAVGLPGQGPYHGSLPGIYHPEHSNSGRLGKKEQSLVIADVDPVYSPEGKPRPQMLPPPLSLVAHLPIIESLVAKPGARGCQCQRRSEDRSGLVRSLARDLLEKFASLSGNTAQDRAPQELAKLLERLEQLVRTSEETAGDQIGWLAERRKAFLAEHAASPRQWPPPVAVDWLYADLAQPSGGFPKLEVPAYSLARGETP